MSILVNFFFYDRPETYVGDINTEGTVILKEEIGRAMKSLDAGKAVGSDGIDIEILLATASSIGSW